MFNVLGRYGAAPAPPCYSHDPLNTRPSELAPIKHAGGFRYESLGKACVFTLVAVATLTASSSDVADLLRPDAAGDQPVTPAVSKIWRSHIQQLLDWNVVEVTTVAGVAFASRYFSVAKKNGLGRAVISARLASRLFRDPGPVNLIPIPLLISKVRQFASHRSKIIVVDGVNMFYQLPISSALGAYFAFYCPWLAAAVYTIFKVAPMGGGFVPRCCQSIGWQVFLREPDPVSGGAPWVESLPLQLRRYRLDAPPQETAHPPQFVHILNADGKPAGFVTLWYDNFTIVGANDEAADYAHRRLQANAEAVNLKLHPAEVYSHEALRGEAGVSFLGVDFRLVSTKRGRRRAHTFDFVFRASASSAQKHVASALAWPSAKVSPRQVASLLGFRLWMEYVAGRPLCRLASVLDANRRVALASKNGWDSLRPRTELISDEVLASVLADMKPSDLSNLWVTGDSHSVDERLLFVASDACDSGWGVIHLKMKTDDDQVVFEQWRGQFPPDWRGRVVTEKGDKSKVCIYLKEMWAALQAIELLAPEHRGKTLVLAVDNTACAFGLQRMYSGCHESNKLILRIFNLLERYECRLRVVTLRSAENAADAPSRFFEKKVPELTQSLLLTTWRVMHRFLDGLRANEHGPDGPPHHGEMRHEEPEDDYHRGLIPPWEDEGCTESG